METNATIPAVKVKEQESGLSVAMKGETPVEYDGKTSTNADEQKELLRTFARNAILRQFGIKEVQKVTISGGNLAVNEVVTRLKLPAVKRNVKGDFAETLEVYTDRALPILKQWLRDAVANSNTTIKASEAALAKF